jgi:hypothetical protein
MDLEIFTTDEQRQTAIDNLRGFTDLPGWKLIEKVLNINIEEFDQQLRDADFASIDELRLVQKRRSDLHKFKSLPKLILDEARNVLPSQDDDEDDES